MRCRRPRQARSRPEPPGGRRLRAPAVLGISFAGASIPFSGIAARLTAGVDLRTRGTGTVSGTGLYEVSGFTPLAVAGSLEVAAGAVGPLLAGRDRWLLGALAGGVAVTGHNWSPFLGGAGGRGISTVLGATAVLCPEGTAVVGAGLAIGRVARSTGAGCFGAFLALFPILGYRRGARGVVTAACLVLPIFAKRLFGNRPLDPGASWRTYLARLVFDADPDEMTPAATSGRRSEVAR